MGKLLLIARANVRKAKGQTVAIIVLILLAALMLDLWLMLATDYKANFDRYHDKLNAEHVTLVVGDDGAEFRDDISDRLTANGRVAEFTLGDCLSAVGTFPYNGGVMNGQFVFTEKTEALERSIGRAEITEDGGGESGVYLPMLYESDDIAVGKHVEITVGSYTAKYTVIGFFNSIMMGSHNCSLTQILITKDKYDELAESGAAMASTLCSVRLKERSGNLEFEAELKRAVGELLPEAYKASNCYDIVSQSRYIAQMITSGIMSAMAFFVLLIALVVIVSNIVNYIQVNMKNLGALKATGYTSRQLVGAFLMQFLGVTLVTALLGAAAAYALFPAVNAMMISQTGIPYAIRFLPLPIFASLGILCATVALAVLFATRRIKKIEPIVALRSGITTHSFKRNRVPLDRGNVPLDFALALKTTLSGIKNNITVGLTMAVLSLVVVFSGLMTENVIADMTPFLDLIVGETSDSCINVNVDEEDAFLAALDTDARVEKAYLYNSINISHVGGAELMATLGDDFSEANNQNVVYKGRFPKYANEIALAAKYAKENGFAVGREIEIAFGGNTAIYLICGLTQITNNLGRDCLLTREGFERLGSLTNASYYIDLVGGTDIDAFNAEMKERFFGSVNVTINVGATVEGAASVYVSLMTVIVVAILVLSAVVVAFVLYLLVRTLLNNKKRDYGVLKAIGFTTGRLILQTALSFMPAMILSTVVGLALSCLIINPLTALFLSGIGIVKCTFTVPIGFTAVGGAALVALSFALTCLLSLRIKRIAPRDLLSGE